MQQGRCKSSIKPRTALSVNSEPCDVGKKNLIADEFKRRRKLTI